MRAVVLANANASVIAVTNTATSVLTLIDTAGATTHSFPTGLTGVDLFAEDGDIRYLHDGNTPTTSKGYLLKRGERAFLRKIDVSNLKLIRTGSSNVAVGVSVGYADDDENSSFSNPEVGLNTAITAVNGAGAEESSILTEPGRRPDAFHAQFNGTCSTSVQAVKTATASKKHYITDLHISTDTAGWYSIVDGATTVLLGPYYMPANSVLPVKFATPVPGSTNTALNVDCSGSSGNVTVIIEGYTI